MKARRGEHLRRRSTEVQVLMRRMRMGRMGRERVNLNFRDVGLKVP